MKRTEKILLFLLISAFAFGFVLVSLLRHARLESFGYDLGIYDQAIWLWSKFRISYSTIKDSHIFGDHLIPTLFLISPIYWFIDRVEALLVFQAIWVATGAIPIFLLAKEKLGNYLLSFVLAFAYLSFFGVQNGVVFDFHPQLVAVPLLGWWFYFFEKDQKVHFLILLLLLGIQENVSLLVLSLGVMVALKKRTRKQGLIIMIASLAWFVAATKFIIPYFAQDKPFSYLPQRFSLNPINFLRDLFLPFVKTRTILVSLGAFGFLPIFFPPILIPLFEQFIERFVSNIVATRWGTGLHYSALLAPILAYGTIKGLKVKFFQKRKLIVYGFGFLIFGIAVSYQYFLHLPLNMLTKRNFYHLPEGKKHVFEAVTLIDKQASVATQNNLISHLSHRENIFVFSSCGDVPDPSRGMYCQPLIDLESTSLPLIEREKVEFILVDFSPTQNPNNFFPDGEERLKKYTDKLLLDKKYKIRFKEQEVILLERI